MLTGRLDIKDKWVEGIILDVIKCLKSDKLPGSGSDCDFCKYREDVRAAIDALLSGQSVSSDQKPSIGCGIKWKSI